MILHGHTRESIEAISTADKAMLYRHCATGAIGPLASPLNTFRLASYVRSLQGTVKSLTGKGGIKDIEFGKAFPEAAALIKPARRETLGEKADRVIRAAMARWEAKGKTDGKN